MDSESAFQFHLLERDAINRLRAHAFIDDRNAHHVFQYFVVPSFTPAVSWDVFQRRRIGAENEYVLYRSCWRRDVDLEKFCAPSDQMRSLYPASPTIDVHRIGIDSPQLEAVGMALRVIAIPIGARDPFGGVDGVTYEVALEQPPHYFASPAKCRVSWWHEPPAEWQSLHDWSREVGRTFESFWAAHPELCVPETSIAVIDDAKSRAEAQQHFHKKNYARAAEILADVATRETLTAAERKMLEMAIGRMGGN